MRALTHLWAEPPLQPLGLALLPEERAGPDEDGHHGTQHHVHQHVQHRAQQRAPRNRAAAKPARATRRNESSPDARREGRSAHAARQRYCRADGAQQSGRGRSGARAGRLRPLACRHRRHGTCTRDGPRGHNRAGPCARAREDWLVCHFDEHGGFTVGGFLCKRQSVACH